MRFTTDVVENDNGTKTVREIALIDRMHGDVYSRPVTDEDRGTAEYARFKNPEKAYSDDRAGWDEERADLRRQTDAFAGFIKRAVDHVAGSISDEDAIGIVQDLAEYGDIQAEHRDEPKSEERADPNKVAIEGPGTVTDQPIAGKAGTARV